MVQLDFHIGAGHGRPDHLESGKLGKAVALEEPAHADIARMRVHAHGATALGTREALGGQEPGAHHTPTPIPGSHGAPVHGHIRRLDPTGVIAGEPAHPRGPGGSVVDIALKADRAGAE